MLMTTFKNTRRALHSLTLSPRRSHSLTLRSLALLPALLFFAGIAFPAAAIPLGLQNTAFGQAQPNNTHVRARLEPPAGPVAPGGSGKLVLELAVEEKWHIYGSGPVEFAYPTEVKVEFPAGIQGGALEWPPAQAHYDELLKVTQDIYEGTIQIGIPFTVGATTPAGELPVKLKVSWQACRSQCVQGEAELSAKIQIAGAPVVAPEKPAAVSAAKGGGLKAVMTKGPEPNPLTGEPYKMQVTMELDRAELAPGEEATVSIHLELEPEYHTYAPDNAEDGGMPMKMSSATLMPVGNYEGPPAKKVFDKNLNVTNFEYEGSVTLKHRVKLVEGGLKGGKAAFSVKALVCNESGCLPPAEWVGEFAVVEKAGGAPPVVPDNSDTTKKPAAGATGGDKNESSDNSVPAKRLSLGEFLVAAALGGWASLFTPCVFPMIPITVSFFSKRSKGKRGRAVTMASTYTLGIIGTFTLIGVVVSIAFGATGLANFATNFYVNLGMGLLFVVLGLSLLGLFNITAPAALTDRVEEAKGSARNDYVMTLLMAIAFTLASFTCTVPVLGTLLTLAADKQDLTRPALGMLAYSSAFAAPFFFLALFPTILQKMPKGGAWLEVVKISMGFVEIAAALKFISNADLAWNLQYITMPVFIAIWIALFLGLAFYLFGMIKLPGAEGEIGPVRAMCATGVLAFALYLFTGLFGGSMGAFLTGFFPPPDYGVTARVASVQNGGAVKSAEELAWIEQWDEAKRVAKATNTRIFVDFTGVVCPVCRAAEIGIFPKPRVHAELKKYVRARLWLDRVDTPEHAKESEFNAQFEMQKFKTTAKPYYAIFEPDGETVVGEFGFPGTPAEEDFLNFLLKAAAKK